jgi:hypothetical protein
MRNFDELLKKLNENSVECSSCDGEENIPGVIWEDYFENEKYKVVARELNHDEHRWFHLSTTVIEIFGRYLGIRHVSSLNSESMGVSDCSFDCEFFEMEKIPSFTFKKKEVS